MEEVSLDGARAVLANFTGDLSFDDYNEASNIVHEAVGDDSNIFIGAVIDPSMGDEMRVTLIATGFNGVKTKRVSAANGAAAVAADGSRLVSYRPQRLVTDRPVVAVPEAGLEATAQAKNLVLERPQPGVMILDDRNIPAFLRKQAD